jgi:hypothetical protein
VKILSQGFKFTEAKSDQFELDLVEISPNAEPPVCNHGLQEICLRTKET